MKKNNFKRRGKWPISKWIVITLLLTTFLSLSIKAQEASLELSSNIKADQLDNAIDSSLSSRWTTGEKQSAGQYIVIKLDQIYEIDQVTMLTSSKSMSEQDYPRSYEVNLSNDGNNFGSVVVAGDGSATGTTIINLEGNSAQYIKITQTGSDNFYWWSIHDLSVTVQASNTNNPPQLTFVSPTPLDGSQVGPNEDWSINVSATDVDGDVESVSLYVDGELVSAQSSPPYQWDTQYNSILKSLSKGEKEFKAVAKDNVGAISNIITYLLLLAEDATQNTLPFGEFITPSPIEGSTINENSAISINVEASDSDGSVSYVRLYVDNQFVRQENVTPYEWNGTRDSLLNGLSVGNHILRAEIVDNDGGKTQINRSFTVGQPEPGNSLPQVAFISPTPGNGSVVGEGVDIEVTASATDVDDNLESVTLYLNSIVVGVDLVAPYNWTSDLFTQLQDLSEGQYRLRVVAQDTEGATSEQIRTFRVSSTKVDGGKDHFYELTAGPDQNPMKGWNSGWGDDRPETTVGFQYIDWKEFEPANDQFNFAYLENLIARGGSKDRHVILRIYCDWDGRDGNASSARGCPDWIYTQVGVKRLQGSNGKYITDYNDSRYLEQADQAIQSLGEYFDNDPRVYAIQLGILGYWGEWHTWDSQINGSTFQIDQQSEQKVIDSYRTHFPNTQLMARYPYRSILQSTTDIGFHNDYFKPNNGHSDEFDTAVENGSRWLDGPIGGEVPPGLSGDDDFAMYQESNGLDMISKGRYSTMKPGSVSASNLASHLSLHKRFGYQFQIARAQFSNDVKRDQVLPVTIDLNNVGIAPFYYDWDMQLALLDTDGTPVKQVALQNFNLSSLLPGSAEMLTESIDLDGLQAQSYQLAIRIIQPGADTPKTNGWKLNPRYVHILFANDMPTIPAYWQENNALGGGWSILGEINVGD